MPLDATRLWIVATPIGNSADLSPRASEILASVDVVLAEDTRRTGLLCASCGIRPKKLTSFFEHNEEERQEQILRLLKQGKSVALVSDAGTPLLSDPGYRLVRACRQCGIGVSPVPGPSAPVAAISACGVAPLPFTFLGFLPRGVKARVDLFNSYKDCPGSIVFFERKDRLRESLELASQALGSRELCICRELTKIHEEFISGRLENWESVSGDLPGELTVVIGAPEQTERPSLAQVEKILQAELAEGAKTKQAVASAKIHCPGWSSSELYGIALKLNGD